MIANLPDVFIDNNLITTVLRLARTNAEGAVIRTRLDALKLIFDMGIANGQKFVMTPSLMKEFMDSSRSAAGFFEARKNALVGQGTNVTAIDYQRWFDAGDNKIKGRFEVLSHDRSFVGTNQTGGYKGPGNFEIRGTLPDVYYNLLERVA